MTQLTQATREDLIQALAHALQYEGKRRSRGAENLMAKIVAERLADYLGRANFVVMRAEAAAAPSASRAPAPPET